MATSEEAAAVGLRDGRADGRVFAGGDMRFVDLNSDGIINENDKTVIGDPNPDIFGNFSTSLHYKNWTLERLLQLFAGG